MNINSGKSDRGGNLDTEIERDVAELRQLLSRVQGPVEPHPAYWQNFVVHVHNRIDAEGARKQKKPWLSTAWASVGAAAAVAILALSGVLTQPTDPKGGKGISHVDAKSGEQVVASPSPASSNLAAAYSDAGSRSLVLSEQDVKMVNAIESNNDNAIFEALAAPEL